VTAHEGLETLTVGKLDKQFAAVTFHQAEGIELARVTLVEKCTEVTPVDLEAFTRPWLHAHIGTLGRSLSSHRVQVIFQDAQSTGEAKRTESLRNHHALAFGSCSSHSPMVDLNGSSLLARCRRAALRAGVARY
jgi:hypothetical protein